MNRRFLAVTTLCGCAVLLATPLQAWAADEAKKKPAGEKHAVVVGRSLAVASRLVGRTAPDKSWNLVRKGEKLYDGELLVAGTGARIENAKGTVTVGFLGNLDGKSPLPIVESAVVLHPAKDVDLDLTLDRGRIDVVNKKKKGPARVRVRVRDKSALLTLKEPEARVALEVYGRWLAGVPFVKEPPPGYGPALEILLIVLKGSVDVKGPRTEQRMTAPPGPALIHLDTAAGRDPVPERLDELPAWARESEQESEDTKQRKAALTHLALLAQTQDIGAALDVLADSDKPAERRLAVFAMGALDDLDRLARVLMRAKHQDLWDNGVLALRHWIGRKPGQDQLLYHALTSRYQVPAAQAETVMQLLHSFGEEQLRSPETYELLIDHLNSDRLAIRGLSYWHLSRLVPAGKSIAYDPLADAKERVRAQEQWRKLIPPGQLPSAVRTNEAGLR